MAVGLARTLRVGELVERAPRGIVSVIVSLLDEAGDRPAVLVRGACQRG